MTTLDPQSRFTPDDRYELASRAQTQERQNHPSHLVLLGVFLLALALIFIVVAWKSDSNANKKLSTKSFQFNMIKAELDTIAALESASSNTQRDAKYDKITNMRARQESIASAVGLEASIGLPKTNDSQYGNAIRRNYTYTVRDGSLEKILEWIQTSTEQIPGLAVSVIEIKPTNNTWTVLVTMHRYERIE